MAHEKVYGICEDKCRKEVVPMQNIIEMAIDIKMAPNNGITVHQVRYPTGCNAYNTAVINTNVSQYADKTKTKVALYCRKNDSVQSIANVFLEESAIGIFINTDLFESRTNNITIWLKLLKCE